MTAIAGREGISIEPIAYFAAINCVSAAKLEVTRRRGEKHLHSCLRNSPSPLFVVTIFANPSTSPPISVWLRLRLRNDCLTRSTSAAQHRSLPPTHSPSDSADQNEKFLCTCSSFQTRLRISHWHPANPESMRKARRPNLKVAIDVNQLNINRDVIFHTTRRSV